MAKEKNIKVRVFGKNNHYRDDELILAKDDPSKRNYVFKSNGSEYGTIDSNFVITNSKGDRTIQVYEDEGKFCPFKVNSKAAQEYAVPRLGEYFSQRVDRVVSKVDSGNWLAKHGKEILIFFASLFFLVSNIILYLSFKKISETNEAYVGGLQAVASAIIGNAPLP